MLLAEVEPEARGKGTDIVAEVEELGFDPDALREK